MQQTQKYKLNLIESSDPFLPEGLNQNTQKIEEVLSENLEGMESRVTVLEDHKMAFGSYSGQYAPGDTAERYFHTGFAPKFVLLWQRSSQGDVFGTSILPEVGSADLYARSVEDGFFVRVSMNYRGTPYEFLALR